MSAAEPQRVFAALGDATRLQLMTRLADGRTASISGLSADTRLTRQAVTKHLVVLEGAGLVRAERAGRERRFRLDEDGLAPARAYLDEVARQWDAALERLRLLVE